MVPIPDLWLPILASAVGVFIASSLVWMVLPHHRNDWKRVPDEDRFRAAVRDLKMPPGQYSFPNCARHADMNDPAYQQKLAEGPTGMLVLLPPGPPRMGKALGQWAAFLVLVSMAVAYVAGRTLLPGADALAVFRIAGTVAFLAYAAAVVPNAIWTGHSWSSVSKSVLDGLAYGLITGGFFAWLWP